MNNTKFHSNLVFILLYYLSKVKAHQIRLVGHPYGSYI